MDPTGLSSFVAFVLAISLATERLVTILKTVFAQWLADPPPVSPKATNPALDWRRRFAVQLVAFSCAWITVGFVAYDGRGFAASMLGRVPAPGLGGFTLPSPLLALLASGGSAFWSGLLGYTQAVKDSKRTDTATAAARLTSAGVVDTAAAAALCSRISPSEHSEVRKWLDAHDVQPALPGSRP